MDAKIIHRVDDTITAYIDGEKVKICYITGYLSGKGDVKIQFKTEDERLKKFVEYCEKTPRSHKSTIRAYNRRK